MKGPRCITDTSDLGVDLGISHGSCARSPHSSDPLSSGRELHEEVRQQGPQQVLPDVPHRRGSTDRPLLEVNRYVIATSYGKWLQVPIQVGEATEVPLDQLAPLSTFLDSELAKRIADHWSKEVPSRRTGGYPFIERVSAAAYAWNRWLTHQGITDHSRYVTPTTPPSHQLTW